MWAVAWWIFKLVLVAAISTGIGYLLRQKPERAKPAGKDAFELPTAEEGRPLPVLSGCRRIRGVNAISPLIYLYAQRSGSSKRPNTFYYYISLLLGVSHANLDRILQFWMAETCLWPVLNDPSVRASDGLTYAYINAGECWGGWRREGGARGAVHIQYGAEDQTLHPYLESKLGSNQPAYRGLVTLILENFYIGTVPVIKPISVLAKRTQKMTDGSEMWYLAKAAVGSDGDLNPIHFIYERLFCPITGLGKDLALCGASFQPAADTCYIEGYGISNLWDWAPDEIDSMINQVEEIIDGKLYMDPSTGKFEIGLIRPGYNPDLLDSFGPDDFWVETMPTSSPGKVPSKTIVRWHDRVNLQERPAVDDDIALLARQGGHPVVNELDYSAFVCDGDLANKIAARTQMVFSAMPKRYTLRALRTMSHLHETSIIKISYPALNIVSMIVRVMAIDRGSLSDGGCVIDVVEDVFGQAYTVYGSPPAAGTAPAEEESGERGIDEGLVDIVITVTASENGPY